MDNEMTDAECIEMAQRSKALAEACRAMNNGQPAFYNGVQLRAVDLFLLLETIDHEAADRGEALIEALVAKPVEEP